MLKKKNKPKNTKPQKKKKKKSALLHSMQRSNQVSTFAPKKLLDLFHKYKQDSINVEVLKAELKSSCTA